MSLLTRVVRICEKRSELVDRVYQNLAFGIVTFGGVAIALNRILPYRTLTTVSIVALIALFIIPLVIGFKIRDLSEQQATSLFYAYAVSYGAVFASILLMYSLTQITIAVGMTSLLFLLALYAARSMKIEAVDVKLLAVGFFVLFAMSILNMFLKLSVLELVVCVLGMVVMVGLSAYEISQFEAMNLPVNNNTGKLAILISLSLLSKVINILIYALRFLSVTGIGRRRD